MNNAEFSIDHYTRWRVDSSIFAAPEVSSLGVRRAYAEKNNMQDTLDGSERPARYRNSTRGCDGGMGIDATVPFGYESDFMRPVYPVDKIDLKKWFSEKDIQNAKARMQGWVHSLARTGR